MILIAGLPYSGTTMLVDLLEAMGVNMGDSDHMDINTGEDRIMTHIEGEARDKEIARRNKEHNLWGHKDPYAFRKNQAGDQNILIFRDLIAMQRKQTFRDLGLTVGDFDRAYKWGIHNGALMLSYERALIDPETTIRELARFIGVELSDEKVAELIATIEPGKGHRLE